MARRSLNSHQVRLRELPFAARLHRVDPFRTADRAELEAAAERIAGPRGWCSFAGWKPADVDHILIRFETQAEAAAMQRWIVASGIETRPPPERFAIPQLTVADYNRPNQE
jgi:hypothetical protein